MFARAASTSEAYAVFSPGAGAGEGQRQAESLLADPREIILKIFPLDIDYGLTMVYNTNMS